MSNAFAPIVRARPCPIFGRPVHPGFPPIDYSPILLLKPFGFRITPDTLSSTEITRWPARHYPRLWIQRPSSERRRDFNPPDSCAAQRTLWRSLTSHGRPSSASTLHLPDAVRNSRLLRPAMRPPRFRRVPFRRDVVSDSGGASTPRITASHMLPSTLMTVSASANLWLSKLNTHPIRLLCTLHGPRRRCPRNTRYRAASYGLTRAGLSPAGTRQLRLAHHEPHYVKSRPAVKILRFARGPQHLGCAICESRLQTAHCAAVEWASFYRVGAWQRRLRHARPDVIGDRESSLFSHLRRRAKRLRRRAKRLRRRAKLDLYSLGAFRDFSGLLDVEVEDSLVKVSLDSSILRFER